MSSAKDKALVLDAGTTNIKVLVFDNELNVLHESSRPNPKTFPGGGCIEQDPEGVFKTSKDLLEEALRKFGEDILFLGITNQRESIVGWDGITGHAIYPLIVWEDERTKAYCEELKKDSDFKEIVRQKTGLEISPYFSASKIKWIKDNVSAVSQTTIFGTLDSWLVYKLTGGKVYKTDYTNAARTLLYNIQDLNWDQQLLSEFGVRETELPQVDTSYGDFGEVTVLSKKLPISAVMGDQQASLYAAGIEPGTVKVTMGTGIFPMKIIVKFELKDGFFTTLAVSEGDQPLYALETKIEKAAARVSVVLGDSEKLEEIMKVLAEEISEVVEKLADNQTKKIVLDGGISQNDVICKEIARLTGIPVTKHKTHEGTALGVAKLLFDRRK